MFNNKFEHQSYMKKMRISELVRGKKKKKKSSRKSKTNHPGMGANLNSLYLW